MVRQPLATLQELKKRGKSGPGSKLQDSSVVRVRLLFYPEIYQASNSQYLAVSRSQAMCYPQDGQALGVTGIDKSRFGKIKRKERGTAGPIGALSES